MRKRTKSNLKFFSIAIIFIAGTLSFLAYDQLNGSQFQGIGTTFEVPTLSFAGATSTNINPAIECNVKHTAYAIDSAGGIITSVQSQLASGNPLLDLTSGGKSMAGYVVQLKMWCGNDAGATLIVPAGSFTMTQHANDKSGKPVLVAQKTFSTQRTVFEQGASEKVLGYASTYASEVEKLIDDGSSTFNSLQTFQTYGNLKIHWDGYSGIQYDVPIPLNSMKSFHTAQITNDNTNDQEFADPDGDGIINKYDSCDNERETFNGYQDGDGCPDVNPDTSGNGGTDSTSEPEVVTQESCNTDGKTWYKASYSNSGVCGTKQTFTSGDAQIMCNIWHTDENKCHEPQPVDSVSNNVSGQIFWNVDVTKTDGGVFKINTDPSPFEFAVPLNVLGYDDGGALSSISKITFTPTLKMSDPSTHKLTTVNNVVATFQVLTGISENNQTPQWKTVKTDTLDGFAITSGSSRESGIPLGSLVVTAQEIEAKISSSEVPLGTKKNLYLRINTQGTGTNFVDITVNNGQLITERISLDTGGTVEDRNELSFQWTNLQLIRGDVGSSSGSTTPQTKEECEALSNDKLTYGWINNTCVLIDDGSNNKETCIAKGGTWNEETSQCLAGKDPNPTSGGMCKLDTGSGDSNGDGVICQICTDDASGVGGFPCDEPYRIDYCNGTTKCGSSEGGSDVPQCDDLFADLSNGCVVGAGESCPDNFEPFVKGTELQCNPTIELPTGGDKCPDTGSNNILSLASNVCIVTPPTPITTTTNTSFGSTIPESTMWLLGGIIAVVGIGAIIVKRMRQ